MLFSYKHVTENKIALEIWPNFICDSPLNNKDE